MHIYKVRKFKRDTSWANDPITITRINEHSHPSNGSPSLLSPSPWASFEFGHSSSLFINNAIPIFT